jgi:hypothetical protein
MFVVLEEEIIDMGPEVNGEMEMTRVIGPFSDLKTADMYCRVNNKLNHMFWYSAMEVTPS